VVNLDFDAELSEAAEAPRFADQQGSSLFNV
jgi:hypothetical protein